MSIKVLIIDDSALIRQMLTQILDSDPNIEVVGTAGDPYIARNKIKKLNPDVLTLDVEMPRMNGIKFLENLMRLWPMPVVMISSVAEQGAEATLKALELGAVDYISKPKVNIAKGLEEYAEEIVAKVKMAADARVRTLDERNRINKEIIKKGVSDLVKKRGSANKQKSADQIIAIGASAGGTEAIADVLRHLPPDMPGIVVTQHMPGPFTKSFAARINSYSQLTVSEAKDGDIISRGHVYIAPGDKHLEIKKGGSGYICKLNDGPLVNRHKPAVDVMFHSLAKNVGSNTIGILMTGMGRDGAGGLEAMKKSGAVTLVQVEKSSVVWGMPREAIKRGVVDEVVSLQSMPGRLIELCAIG
jgi:two-component system chemotaxis response regulator CheB